MLRRDPTTIHLVAEDIKDIGRGIDGSLSVETNRQSIINDLMINQELDNHNWDSSLDESYLGSRSREREIIDYQHNQNHYQPQLNQQLYQSQQNQRELHQILEMERERDTNLDGNNNNHDIDDNSLLGSLVDESAKK